MEKECKCNENCTCGEECNCSEEVKCSEDCTCGESCNCEDNCECDDECDCEDHCECEGTCDCEEKSKKDIKKEKKKKKNDLEEKVKTLENELLKSKADFINYRKRLEEENSRLLKYCNEDIIKEILPILDNFERAIKLDDNNLADELSKFLTGFKMIYCNLVNILKNNGVVEIDGNNKPFNPIYHEAIMTEKSDAEPGMVLEVLQKGYILKGKVIRPAMVKVSE